MSEVVVLPDDFAIRVRLLAAELAGKKWSARHQAIKRAAGRLHEEVMYAGRARWEAVKIQDALTACTIARLYDLDRQRKQQTAPSAPIIAFKTRKEAAA